MAVDGNRFVTNWKASVSLHREGGHLVADKHLANSTRYQLIGYSIMMISALVLFRGFSAVTIVALSPAVGVAWTMGMLRFFELQDNPFTDIIVPVLISLVGLMCWSIMPGSPTPDGLMKPASKIGSG